MALILSKQYWHYFFAGFWPTEVRVGESYWHGLTVEYGFRIGCFLFTWWYPSYILPNTIFFSYWEPEDMWYWNFVGCSPLASAFFFPPPHPLTACPQSNNHFQILNKFNRALVHPAVILLLANLIQCALSGPATLWPKSHLISSFRDEVATAASGTARDIQNRSILAPFFDVSPTVPFATKYYHRLSKYPNCSYQLQLKLDHST